MTFSKSWIFARQIYLQWFVSLRLKRKVFFIHNVCLFFCFFLISHPQQMLSNHDLHVKHIGVIFSQQRKYDSNVIFRGNELQLEKTHNSLCFHVYLSLSYSELSMSQTRAFTGVLCWIQLKTIFLDIQGLTNRNMWPWIQFGRSFTCSWFDLPMNLQWLELNWVKMSCQLLRCTSPRWWGI